MIFCRMAALSQPWAHAHAHAQVLRAELEEMRMRPMRISIGAEPEQAQEHAKGIAAHASPEPATAEANVQSLGAQAGPNTEPLPARRRRTITTIVMAQYNIIMRVLQASYCTVAATPSPQSCPRARLSLAHCQDLVE